VEDLACFNDELLARAIYASEIPIVSAVGHEIDFTIADFVADVRAPTPTAAADMVVKDKGELLASIAGMEEKLRSSMKRRVEGLKLLLYHSFVELKERKDLFTKHRIYVDEISSALVRAVMTTLEQRRVKLHGLGQRLEDLNPQNILKRGYSITVKKGTREVLKDTHQVERDDSVTVKLFKGELDCIVSDIITS
jgi:exodeoxyribonuclease VII large subunit